MTKYLISAHHPSWGWLPPARQKRIEQLVGARLMIPHGDRRSYRAESRCFVHQEFPFFPPRRHPPPGSPPPPLRRWQRGGARVGPPSLIPTVVERDESTHVWVV